MHAGGDIYIYVCKYEHMLISLIVLIMCYICVCVYIYITYISTCLQTLASE